jgi:hypothetical protein
MRFEETQKHSKEQTFLLVEELLSFCEVRFEHVTKVHYWDIRE